LSQAIEQISMLINPSEKAPPKPKFRETSPSSGENPRLIPEEQI
jgi:hypothetical protein